MIRVAQCVTRERILQTNHRNDLTGTSLIKRGAILRVHFIQAADIFTSTISWIEHAASLGQLARINAQVGQVASDIADHFEHQGGERRVFAVRPRKFN